MHNAGRHDWDHSRASIVRQNLSTMGEPRSVEMIEECGLPAVQVRKGRALGIGTENHARRQASNEDDAPDDRRPTINEVCHTIFAPRVYLCKVCKGRALG